MVTGHLFTMSMNLSNYRTMSNFRGIQIRRHPLVALARVLNLINIIAEEVFDTMKAHDNDES